MFKLNIRHPVTFESRAYYCDSFEVRPDTWHPDRQQVIMYGTPDMIANFPHRKDAGEIVITNSYIMVDTYQPKY